MTPQEKARELVEDFMSVRMEIKTKMDSIPTVISDYPSPDTAKKCAPFKGELPDHLKEK